MPRSNAKFGIGALARPSVAARRGSTRGEPAVRKGGSRALAFRFLLVAVGADDLCHGAVRRAEFQRTLAGSRDDGPAAGLDLGDVGVAVVDFDPPMVDTRAGAGQLC